jgi:hypothetical protein
MTPPNPEPIEHRIRPCRGRPALLVTDLAALYGLSTGALLDCVQRHGPLPGEFAFFADPYEPPDFLRDRPRGCPPYVFTEHGALAAAYLVGTAIAIAQSIAVLRAFARFRLSDGGEGAPAPSAGASSPAGRPLAAAATISSQLSAAHAPWQASGL